MHIQSTARAWAGATLFLVLAGCGTGLLPDSNARLEQLNEESVSLQEELNDLLLDIEDEAMLKAAIPKARDLTQQILPIAQEIVGLVQNGAVMSPEKSTALAKRTQALSRVGHLRMVFGSRFAWEDMQGSDELKKILTEFGRKYNDAMTQIREAKKKAFDATLSPKSKQTREDLKALGKIYHAYHDANRTGPDSWSTAEEFCQQYAAWQKTLKSLHRDGVVVHWGISFMQAKVGTSNYVLAYEKSTPKSGGWVLRLDGSVAQYDPKMLQFGLQTQAQVDKEVFGQSPPVPVEFPPELTQNRGSDKNGNNKNVAPAKPAPPQGIQGDDYGDQDLAQLEKDKQKQAQRAKELESRAQEQRERMRGGPDFGNGRTSPLGSRFPTALGRKPPESNARDLPPSRSPIGAPSSTLSTGAATPMSTTSVPFQDSPLVGGSGGTPFRTVSPDGQMVVGVRYRIGSWAGQASVAKIEGMSERTQTGRPWEYVVARQGYALGAVQVDASEFVHALRFAFMRIDGDRLDTKDSYVSEWIGSPSGATPKTLNGNGAPVIGFHGRDAAIVDAVGLIFAAD